MKRVIVFLLFAVVFFSFGQENLIKDANFSEAGGPFKDWKNYAGGEGTKAEIVAEGRNGNALRIIDNTKEKGVGKQQTFAIEAGNSYRATVWAKLLEGHNDGGVFLQIRTLPDSKIFQKELKGLNSETFSEIQLDFTVPEGQNQARLFLYSQTITLAGMLIDEVKVNKLIKDNNEKKK
jgi:hypothetical protein